jgi:hypothetical protein
MKQKGTSINLCEKPVWIPGTKTNREYLEKRAADYTTQMYPSSTHLRTVRDGLDTTLQVPVHNKYVG